MRRCLTLCLVVLCALSAQAAAARPQAPRGIRVQIAPGASLLFPSNWVVCAGDAERSPYRFAGITKVACGSTDPDSIRMRYEASGMPVDLFIAHTDDPAITEPVMKSAPPEFVSALSSQLCATIRGRAGYDVGSCKWDMGTVAGHAALISNGTQTADRDPLKLRYALHSFSVADKGGYLVVVAMTPVMVRGKTDAVIRALEDSLLVDTGTPDAPLPLEFVKLSPAPGVSLTVPKGWIACDTVNDALLGNASDPMNSRLSVCGPDPASLGFQLRVFNPRPLRTSVFSVHFDHEVRLSEEAMRALASVPAASLREKVCPEATAPMIAQHITIEVCEVSVSSIGGHAAVITDIVGLPPDNILARFSLKVIEITYPGGYLQLQTDTPLSLASVTKPDLEAILNSMAFGDGTAPPATGSNPGTPKIPEPPKAPPNAI